ncbi:hypothetical protein C6341_g3553 [Phytophthora cactorum]|nr:hypothetical protein C6341_g3553 [Phytophthora cactorum]
MEGSGREQLRGVESSGGGGENGAADTLRGAASDGGGGGGDDQQLEGRVAFINNGETGRPAGDVAVVAVRTVKDAPAAERAEGASSSTPKRKRGRPKGSKNRPKATNDAEPNRKRGRPAGCKASPKRSLTQAMGHAPAAAPPAVQPRSTAAQILSPRKEISTTSAPADESEANGPLLRDTIVPGLTSPAGSSAGTPRTKKEGWTKRQKAKDKYVGVGNAYLVCRIVKGAMFRVQWLDSQYQNKDEHLNLNMIQPDEEDIQVEGDIDEMEECMEMFDPPMELPTTLAEVEAIKKMRFEPGAQSEEPVDLYRHADGITTTRLLPQVRHLFEHSASASFFAYIPVSFWQQVVGETNSYVRVHGIALAKPFALDEIMAFLGVLFYMELVDKGEYSNYWGQQVEDAIFGGSSVSLGAVMSLRRFKQLRQAFCFRCIEVTATIVTRHLESGLYSTYSR